MRFGIPPIGQDFRLWGEDLRRFLARFWDNVSFKVDGATPTSNGILLWDDVNGYPVISKNNEWRQIVLGDGHAIFAQDATITAASADTAYAIQFDTPSLAADIALDPTNTTRIVFSEGGLYRISFTAQIASSSASTLEFRFWPRINGTNITGSTMVASLHNNGATIVASRDSIFQFSAGDYLEAMWATTSTSGSLLAHAATAYAPASPSVTMTISRVQA
ncbi:hypothetical protein UFOVP373_25 [uncultured Caudovirales phage]|uniref:Uncharacterized protein n=1 Tax=uncultured Caudovirales phage TaxID=2100421 RepID=A0A6J7X5X3_9CAUD|nr:hypothetical protein UFOVP373_25 [uncultured Caudovirales phage]